MNLIKYFSPLRSSFFAFFVLGLFLQSVAVAMPPRKNSKGNRANPPVASRGVDQRKPEQTLTRWVRQNLGVHNRRLVRMDPAGSGAAAVVAIPAHTADETTEIIYTINTPEDFDQLLKRIRNLQNSHLQSLKTDFKYRKITCQNVEHFAHALRDLSSLKSLSLTFVENLDDDGATALFTALNELKNLETLSFTGSGRDLGVEENSTLNFLITAIQNLSNLREVDLDFSMSLYDGSDMLELIKAIKIKRIKLRNLNLSNSLALEHAEDDLKKEIGDRCKCDWTKDNLPNLLGYSTDEEDEQPEQETEGASESHFHPQEPTLEIAITNLALTDFDRWMERLSQNNYHNLTHLNINFTTYGLDDPSLNPQQRHQWQEKIIALFQKLKQLRQLTHFTFLFDDSASFANETLLVLLSNMIDANPSIQHVAISINHKPLHARSQETEKGINQILEHATRRSSLQSLHLSFIGNISPLGTWMLLERLQRLRGHRSLRELTVTSDNSGEPLINIPNNANFSAALAKAVENAFQK